MKKHELRQTLAILKPRMPEIGKIKIGGLGKKMKAQKSGREYRIPVQYGCFVITTLERNEKTGNFMTDKEMHLHLNDPECKGLNEIPIKLLYNNIGENFPSYLACYDGSTMVCTGDGENANRQDEGIMECPCERFETDYEGKTPCKMNAVLTCMLPLLTTVGAVHKFRTCSFNTIQGITSSLAYISSLTDGILFEIPLKLVITTKPGTNPKTGKKQKVQYVRIEFDGSTDDLIKQGRLVASKTGRKQIAAPADVNDMIGDIDKHEAEEIAAEYYPPDDVEVDEKTGEIIETVDVNVKPEKKAKEKTGNPEKTESSDEPPVHDDGDIPQENLDDVDELPLNF